MFVPVTVSPRRRVCHSVNRDGTCRPGRDGRLAPTRPVVHCGPLWSIVVHCGPLVVVTRERGVMSQMKVAGIIPARWASSRLPGKPLKDILGQPMIQRGDEGA